MPRGRTPLREQAFRIGTFLVGPLIAIVILAGLAISGAFASVPPWVILLVLGVMVIGALVGIGVALIVAKRLVGESIEIAVRGPGDKWHHARADVSPGQMHLQKYWWQLRIPTGESTTLQVEDVGSDERKPKPSQWWSLNPQIRIVDLTTDQGVFQIGGLPSHLAELRERLAPT